MGKDTHAATLPPVSDDSRAPSFSLVLPCYAPQAGWPDRLADRYAAFAKTLPDAAVELIVVHDGTPGGLRDEDVARLRHRLPDARLLSYPTNRGKGYALRHGVREARAPLTLYTDVDLPYTTDSMTRVAEALRTHGGVVAAERFDDYYVSVPRFRRRLSRVHRWAMRRLFRLPVSDSQAGLKGFDERGRDVFLGTTVERFLVDLDFIARCRGRVDVHPVRVSLRPDVVFTDFGLGILRAEAANFGRVLWRSWVGR